MRVLVAGWFSFEMCNATAGDLFSRDVLCGWLREAGVPFDVAVAPPFTDGLHWKAAGASAYSHVVFVCGPFVDEPPSSDMRAKFAGCRWIGLNLTMVRPLAEFNPLDVLFERDSDRAARPDLSFLSDQPKVPVVGLILVQKQHEYGERALHNRADRFARMLLDEREVATIPIDTRIEYNQTHLRTPREIDAVIAKCDAVVTTRLHGTVLALKNGVPAVAIDAIAGGAKVSRQCVELGWPWRVRADALPEAADDLRAAFAHCLSPAGKAEAIATRDRAIARLQPLRKQLLDALADKRS